MKQKPIDFRELLERLLPLDELSATDRFRVKRALRVGVAAEIERAALFALARLEQHGAIQRLTARTNGSRVLRYQTPGSLDVITLELPLRREHEGVRVIPRGTLPSQAEAGLEQLRQLLRMDDTLLLSDPRSGQARASLVQQLAIAGREFLGASDVRFIPAPGAETGEEKPLDPGLAEDARTHLSDLLYCPDTERCPALASAARAGVRAVALAGVASGGGEALGHLEVTSRAPEPFDAEDLALVALLADSFGGALERASRIEKLVFVDPLTTVYNRSYFDLQVQNEMARARRDQTSLALCIADIDDFKGFNTGYGYEAGNQVLLQVAQALRRGVRPFDTVARWGGEEFAVLLTAPVGAEDAVVVSDRLRQQVERTAVALEGLDGGTHRLGVTVSIGVAMFPEHGDSAQDLWRAANRALLAAKRPPKNRVVFYSAET